MHIRFRAASLFIVLISLLVTACEKPASQKDVARLQAELDQLENQLGRLEFRLFELENSAGTQAANETGTAATDEAETTAQPAAPGRFDLTPVE